MKFIVLIGAFVCIAFGVHTEAAPSDDDFFGEPLKLAGSTCVNNGQCSSCFDAPFVGERTCIKANAKASEKLMDFELTIVNKPFIKKTVAAAAGKQKECKALSRPLNFISICLNVDTDKVLFGLWGTTTCSSAEFLVENKVLTRVVTQCIYVNEKGIVSASSFPKVDEKAFSYYKINEAYIKVIKQKIALAKKAKINF